MCIPSQPHTAASPRKVLELDAGDACFTGNAVAAGLVASNAITVRYTYAWQVRIQMNEVCAKVQEHGIEAHSVLCMPILSLLRTWQGHAALPWARLHE